MRVECRGFRVQSVGFRVQGSGFNVLSFGSRGLTGTSIERLRAFRRDEPPVGLPGYVAAHQCMYRVQECLAQKKHPPARTLQ